MTDTHLHAELAHRRHALTRLVDTAADILGQLLGNALIEQQIGHVRASCGTEPKQ